jgi:hypothetical protein
MKPIGWRYESARHALAAKGVRTGHRGYYAYAPTFVAGDLPVIGVDALGTAGAEVVSWIPVVVPIALAYGGVRLLKKKYYADMRKSAESRLRSSELATERWRNPEFREKMAERIRERWKNPEFREKMTERIRKQWKDSEYREKIAGLSRERMTERWTDSEFREFMERMRERPITDSEVLDRMEQVRQEEMDSRGQENDFV